jgi:monovalent cation:H+ antiporter, CPA1 family
VSEVAHAVGAFVALLGAAVLIAILAERVRVPAAVALVAVGALVPMQPPFAFGDVLLFVFLPPLIFEAAWNLDLEALRRTAWRVAVLAVPGTLATAAIVAGALVLAHVLPFGAALLFGAIVSATDPVAVVAAFRRVRVPADLRTLVEGESLSNDGVALVLFAFALVVASGARTSLGADVLLGVLEVAGGVAIGALLGMLCAAVLHATDAAEYEVTVTIVLAYVAYLAATALHCSGIFATAAGAIALRAAVVRLPRAMSNAGDVDRAWSALAFMANAVVFLATGLLIRPDRILHEPLLVLVAVAAVTLARAVLALVAVRDRAGRITVFLAGMRGALPLALALSLPDTLPLRPQIIDATFAVVLVTIVVQGAPLGFVLERLYGGPDANEPPGAAVSPSVPPR